VYFAKPFLHKVTLELTKQHKNWQSVDISLFKINDVEILHFLVAMAKN
jgi:hypothetical protein